MNDLSQSKYGEPYEILTEVKAGIWVIEVESGKYPKMYTDRAMREVLGVSEELTPEQCYDAWFNSIVPEYIEIVESTIANVLKSGTSEVTYHWLAGDVLTVVRCGARKIEEFENGFALRGYHQDISELYSTKLRIIGDSNKIEHLSNSFRIYRLDLATLRLTDEMRVLSFGDEEAEQVEYSYFCKRMEESLTDLTQRGIVTKFLDIDNIKKILLDESEHSTVFTRVKKGKTKFKELSIVPGQSQDDKINICFIIEKDVSEVVERERQSQELLKEAIRKAENTQKVLTAVSVDRMTGLFSKEYFYERGRLLLDKHTDKEFIFLAIDIEDFKAYNAIVGMTDGDHLIYHMAESINSLLLSCKPVEYGRNSVDSFLVIMQNDHNKVRSFERELRRRVREHRNDISIKVVVGEYVIANRDEELFQMHDKATLAAKSCKGTFDKWVGRYTEEMEQQIALHRTLSQDMERAIAEGEFLLHYQPKFDAKSIKVNAAEALVRWNYRNEALLSPAIFIPLFEKNGFIRELDYFVWEQTCKFISENKLTIPISVNVSKANMYSLDLSEKILSLLQKYDVKPRQMPLEFTETAYYGDMDKLRDLLGYLTDMGAKISMDDFGSGYSSLSLLKSITVHELKIDATFIDFEFSNVRAYYILESMVEMSKKLGVHITVEGVETQDQLELLQRLGCDTIQGYLLSKPLPEKDFLKILAERG